MHSKHKGFSLIELIAVIIVIVILSAIVIDRYGAVSNGARNAVIREFVHNCKGVYAKMYYGDSTTQYATVPTSTTKHLSDYLPGGAIGSAVVQVSGTKLTISSIPVDAKMFKTPITTFTADFSKDLYTIDGTTWMSESNFLSQVSW